MKFKNYYKIFLFGLMFFVLSLCCFSLFRVTLFYSFIAKQNNANYNNIELLQAFYMGVRFDIVIVSYFFLIPWILLIFWQFFPTNKVLKNFWIIFSSSIFGFAFFVNTINIPYFIQFFSHLTTAAFAWTDQKKFILGMIFSEFQYWKFGIIFLLIFAAFIYTIRLLDKKILSNLLKTKNTIQSFFITLTLALVGFGLLFLGMRGRTSIKAPIQVGTAYFSSDPFLNQLGLNPLFVLGRSILDAQKPENKTLQLMNENQAIAFTKEIFKSDTTQQNPLVRYYTFPQNGKKRNVVLVLLESMTAAKLQRYGSKSQLTPFLDSLIRHALVFDNCYATGIHTYNGVFSSLCSYPSLKSRHPMKSTEMLVFPGIISNLKNENYYTVYFTTHDDQFDNIGGFLKANMMDEIISQKDYPKDKIQSTLGVSDHFLFEFGLKKINEISKKNNNFFATFLTASDHGPYIIPEGIGFVPKSNNKQEQIVEYVDWSIRKFITDASSQEWFNNTLFVFTADHGAVWGENKFEIPLSYLHIPLIFYAPNYIQPRIITNQLVSQMDIFPTTMNLLNISYENKTFGMDALSDNREIVYFSYNDKIGAITDTLFWMIDEQNNEKLYHLRATKAVNIIDDNKEIALKIKNHVLAQMQTAQWLIKQKLLK